MKRIYISLLCLLLLSLAGTAVLAQEDERDGSIRGTVYLDENGNGVCPEDGEAPHPGVPLEFVSDDGKWSTFLQTGDDGTYGLVAAAYGTWQVSARPNANDFVVTSETTQAVFVGSDEKVALGIDFCIQATDGPIATAGSANAAAVLLPEAGGTANSVAYWMTVMLGLMLLGSGVWLQTGRKS